MPAICKSTMMRWKGSSAEAFWRRRFRASLPSATEEQRTPKLSNWSCKAWREAAWSSTMRMRRSARSAGGWAGEATACFLKGTMNQKVEPFWGTLSKPMRPAIISTSLRQSGEAEARATVAPGGGAVSLIESMKKEGLDFLGDADAGIPDLEP